MRISFCLMLILSGFGVKIFAQVVTADYILGQDIERVDHYRVENNDSVFHLSTGYNNATFKDTSSINEIMERKIRRIDLVYTMNKQHPSFAQSTLNKKRLEELYNKFPRLFDNNLIEWNLIEQDGYELQEEAESDFHGFVFHYANSGKGNNKLTTEEEISILEEWLKKAFPDTEMEEEGADTIHSIIRESISKDKCFIPWSKKKREDEITYSRRSIWFRKRCTRSDEESLTTKIVAISKETKTRRVSYDPYMADPVVREVLKRNKHLDTNTTLLIEDVTGSMYPYIYQTFEWRRKYHSKIKYYTFFNDGDNKPDGLKKIGATGGVYEYEGYGITELEEHVKMVMRKGCGGDGPENNIEAALYALEKFPDADSLIMIVDNYAPVKDISLLKKLVAMKKPVHVILCGCRGMILSDYLRLAIETRGTIHTIEKDISFSKPITDGAIVELGGQKFRYEKGVLVLIR